MTLKYLLFSIFVVCGIQQNSSTTETRGKWRCNTVGMPKASINLQSPAWAKTDLYDTEWFPPADGTPWNSQKSCMMFHCGFYKHFFPGSLHRIVGCFVIYLFIYLFLQILFSVLQLINNIVKDSTGFLENACLVGLVRLIFQSNS